MAGGSEGGEGCNPACAASAVGGGPQLPSPPQPVVQNTKLPQLSEKVPHRLPYVSQVAGVQPQRPATPPPPQLSGSVQPPHGRLKPQPLAISPHSTPCAAHVVAAQPQAPATPVPPQVAGKTQSPQLRVALQPSGRVPQFLPAAAQLVGSQGFFPQV